jgi:hypothetical protein
MSRKASAGRTDRDWPGTDRRFTGAASEPVDAVDAVEAVQVVEAVEACSACACRSAAGPGTSLAVAG